MNLRKTETLQPDDGSVPVTPLTLTNLPAVQKRLSDLEEELAQTKRELMEARTQLREADKLKSEFIATVSHELRTPLNSILGFAKLLLKQKIGPLNQIQRTDISVIYDSAQHLLSLV